MTRIKYPLLVILIVCLPYIAGAEMYQWVDEKGTKHFSNSPPPEGINADKSTVEIKSGETEDQDLKAREAAIIKEAEASQRQAEIDAEKARLEKADQEKLDGLKREQEALGEDIAKKRRYVKRRGKTDINKLKRLKAEIEALKQSPNPDPEKINELEAEFQETKEKFYAKSGRGRKGTKQEVERHYQLEMEIEREEARQAAEKKK